MTLQEFIEKYNGVGNVGNTQENTGQCTGLVSVWTDNLKLPHVWGNAADLLVNAGEAYEVIKNTPDAIPEPGDCIVWTKGFNQTFGHTAIVVKGNVKTFEVFEQNNPLGGSCRLHTYPDYSYVDGWFRKRAIIAQEIAQTDQTIIDLGIYGKHEIQAIRGFYGDAENWKKDLESAKKENEGLTTLVAEYKAIIEDLTSDLNECLHTAPIPPVTSDNPIDDSIPTKTIELAPILQSFLGWLKRLWK
jgi:surface antigen